jgi:hypothetical protein
MSGYVFAIGGALVTLGFMIELLRRRRLREKYAALWITVAVLVLVAVGFPHLLERAASLVGVTLPVNLVFFVALLLLLVVCVQLSAEVSTLEQETQTLAEEVALLRNRVERLERGVGDDPGPSVADPGTGHAAG